MSKFRELFDPYIENAVSSGLVKKIAAVLSERAALKASISGYPSESGWIMVQPCIPSLSERLHLPDARRAS